MSYCFDDKMVVKKDTTVKIKEEIAKKIDKLVADQTLEYKSRSDFIIQAIEKEIEYAKMLQGLDSIRRWRFRDLWSSKKWEIYDECCVSTLRAKELDKSPSYNEVKIEPDKIKKTKK